jgi:hypothetical protein
MRVMEFIKLMSNIKFYAGVIMTHSDKLNINDLIKLKVIRTQLEDIARKYDPNMDDAKC